MELDANYAEGYSTFSILSTYAGEAEQALAAADRASRLDPYSFLIEYRRGQAYFLISEYDRAKLCFGTIRSGPKQLF